MSAPSSLVEPKGTSDRVPRLEEDPSVVKFMRNDCVFYEGDWAPEKYDAELALEIMQSNIEDAVEAERLGYDGIGATEHHFDAWTLVPSPMVYLAAVAARTSRLRLGQAVHTLPLRNPWTLAEEAGMLDLISNGRAEIGVGKGSFAVERARYGLDADVADEMFNEKMELLSKALNEVDVTFAGKYDHIDVPSTVYPKALGDPLRPWVAGFKPDSVAKIGREGHNLYGMISPYTVDSFPHYLRAAQEAGHERSGANYMAGAGIIVAPTDKEAKEIHERAWDHCIDVMTARGGPESEFQQFGNIFTGSIHGSPSTVLDKLGEGLQASGARRVVVVFRTLFIPKEESRQTMHLFAEEVMPHLRNLPT